MKAQQRNREHTAEIQIKIWVTLLESFESSSKIQKRKAIYQKSIKEVINSYFEIKYLYSWPNHYSIVLIRKSLRNDMECLKFQSKWVNLHIFYISDRDIPQILLLSAGSPPPPQKKKMPFCFEIFVLAKSVLAKVLMQVFSSDLVKVLKSVLAKDSLYLLQ